MDKGLYFSGLAVALIAFLVFMQGYALGVVSFVIYVENRNGGEVKLLEAGEWIRCGSVVAPAVEFNKSPFTASQWGRVNEVVASAVNAIHILKEEGLLSILPKGVVSSGASPGSSILTDIRTQESIFGGGYSPFVGSEVSCEPSKGIPRELKIKVLKDRCDVEELIFENKVGGKIIAVHLSGVERVVGKVIKPVEGVGRFLGSEYTGVGRVRANHPGVICVSTSPLGEMGGFQIIPYRHSLSPEMIKLAWGLTQWMIVDAEPGSYPLFYETILPNWNPVAIRAKEWQKLLLRRSLVMVKFDGDSEWRFLPAFSGRDDHALKGLRYIKIILPLVI